MLEGHDIICVAGVGWNSIWTGRQHFMYRLSEKNRVLYVEGMKSFFQLLRNRGVHSDFVQKPKVRMVKRNLYVLSPGFGFLPQRYYGLISKINYLRLPQIIRIWQEKLEICNPILWIYIPEAVVLLRRLDANLRIYTCVDEHSAHPFPNRYKRYLVRSEKELCKNVDIVFVTARGLLHSRKCLNKNTFFVSNGCDFELFARNSKETTEPPHDIRRIPRPILGFVGGIAQWIDLDLVEYMAKANPEWSIVLVGPVAHRAYKDRFDKFKNVYFLGRKPLSVLPNYIQYFDVCLNPFRLTELTKTVNPLKVYDYLAAGKPVVSVDMPEVRYLKSVVRIATTYDDFVRQVEIALTENSDEHARARMEIAKKFSWDNLLQVASEKIEGLLTPDINQRK